MVVTGFFPLILVLIHRPTIVVIVVVVVPFAHGDRSLQLPRVSNFPAAALRSCQWPRKWPEAGEAPLEPKSYQPRKWKE